MNVPTMADYMQAKRRFERHIRASDMDHKQVYELREAIARLNKNWLKEAS